MALEGSSQVAVPSKIRPYPPSSTLTSHQANFKNKQRKLHEYSTPFQKSTEFSGRPPSGYPQIRFTYKTRLSALTQLLSDPRKGRSLKKFPCKIGLRSEVFIYRREERLLRGANEYSEAGLIRLGLGPINYTRFSFCIQALISDRDTTRVTNCPPARPTALKSSALTLHKLHESRLDQSYYKSKEYFKLQHYKSLRINRLNSQSIRFRSSIRN